MRQDRCGVCEGCTNPDCQACRFCLDKKKYGGENRMRRPCSQRTCVNQRRVDQGRRDDHGRMIQPEEKSANRVAGWLLEYRQKQNKIAKTFNFERVDLTKKVSELSEGNTQTNKQLNTNEDNTYWNTWIETNEDEETLEEEADSMFYENLMKLQGETETKAKREIDSSSFEEGFPTKLTQDDNKEISSINEKQTADMKNMKNMSHEKHQSVKEWQESIHVSVMTQPKEEWGKNKIVPHLGSRGQQVFSCRYCLENKNFSRVYSSTIRNKVKTHIKKVHESHNYVLEKKSEISDGPAFKQVKSHPNILSYYSTTKHKTIYTCLICKSRGSNVKLPKSPNKRNIVEHIKETHEKHTSQVEVSEVSVPTIENGEKVGKDSKETNKKIIDEVEVEANSVLLKMHENEFYNSKEIHVKENSDVEEEEIPAPTTIKSTKHETKVGTSDAEVTSTELDLLMEKYLESESENGETVYFCNECDEKPYPSKLTATNHIQVHLNLTIPCNHCDRIFTNTASLVGHRNILHKGAEKGLANVRMFSFEEDTAKIAWLTSQEREQKGVSKFIKKLKRENTQSAKEAPSTNELYEEICGYITSQDGDTGKIFLCKLCDKTSKHKLVVRLHIETHMNYRHSCSLCDFSATNTQTLKVHTKRKHQKVAKLV